MEVQESIFALSQYRYQFDDELNLICFPWERDFHELILYILREPQKFNLHNYFLSCDLLTYSSYYLCLISGTDRLDAQATLKFKVADSYLALLPDLFLKITLASY